MVEIPENERVTAIKTATTSEERTWAAIAHASTVATLLLALGSAGVGGLLLVFVPLLIYLVYRDKSEYVAYHAAQAFALQVVGSVGYFVAILVLTVVLAVFLALTILLSLILVGLILVPVWVILVCLAVVFLVCAPLVLSVFSLIAAVQTAEGQSYRYPYLGEWVEDWLARTEASTAPTV